MDTEKKLQHLQERLTYIKDIFANKQEEGVRLLESRLNETKERYNGLSPEQKKESLDTLEEFFVFMERKFETELTPMDKVRIVRHPQRITLRDILENVYDNYTEIGSLEDHSIDPAVLIARAYVTRKQGKKTINQAVMVIGHEKGHGEEFRNGGSAKPWGNAKALQYMKVAETENIPIHTYVFTPGAFPIEDTPGAAQQIARNLYEMSNLKTPVIAVFSEGGSGGAEAIALSDRRLMFSHGYYSVISPEGGAAIEGRLKAGERASSELIEKCAMNLNITANDNLRLGYIDSILEEPDLGARTYHYEFFRSLRREVLRATDEVYLSNRGLGLFRGMILRRRRKHIREAEDLDVCLVRWNLSTAAKERLVMKRHRKFLKMSRNATIDSRPVDRKLKSFFHELSWDIGSMFKYDIMRKQQKRISYALEEIEAEARVITEKVSSPWRKLLQSVNLKNTKQKEDEARMLTELSDWTMEEQQRGGQWSYVSPKSTEDKAVSCPNSHVYGCLDSWAPDLYGEFAGVCSYCGHHFPMEYQWYMNNVFDAGSIFEFNSELEAGNPLKFPGLDEKLAEAKKRTGLKSSCITFEARINDIKLVVALFVGTFRGGSVGAAEGEKFIRAAERARKKRMPFLAYVHGTAGIRIQEGVNGVIQMPRCTMAVRRYIDAGGLYLVVYDTHSYAGPVASFLGCSPYQFGIRSANIGFAGHGVITETTGLQIPPHYHNVFKAMDRGHIQGIWDRREARFNLQQALLTMGGKNLYYR
ncbi:acetyl-CoA carboxylase carboxyl transferase subunit alpha/beta [Desulfovibrio litoralis]|uniref:Acetyl-coenzyme A carboxylase carboxyl transferase subunits beta/alpha n=1 Tax=Desulfovibrio litoralis DSM 11393 TaxID=1121455 RepID=A0A1M7TK84_9BACT|nr:acetyl-CoA carboxylase carboxyl transferase subunit alpha/beta [Desulfovibrio litoralis]SHN71106.1 acetyl-CoA carboxylase carboxyl transferase subunit beta [Desulfovibrio litoralis DSM 11393]